VLLVRLAVLALVLAPGTLAILAPVLASALIAGLAAFLVGPRRHSADSDLTMQEIRNPAELRTALAFAAFYAVILILSTGLADLAGSKGVYAVALLSSLTDMDAITLSSIRLYGMGALSSPQVAVTVVLALTSNVAFKLGIVRFTGGAELFKRCLPAMLSVIAGAAGGLALFT